MDEFSTVFAVSSSPDLKIIRIDTINHLNNYGNIVITNLYEREIEEYNGEAIVPARGHLTLKFFI